MKFVCIFASLGVAAASMKGKMVVDAYGDIVESSFVDIADTPTTAVAAPADNTTGLNTQQQTALAANDTAQAAVDMQNWAQMTSQMDTYLRRKNAQLGSINTRYDQVKAIYAMYELHGKLVDTLIGRFKDLEDLIKQRTAVEVKAIGSFAKITQNLAQMQVLYAASQTDTLLPGPLVQDSAWTNLLSMMFGATLDPDNVFQLEGFLAGVLFDNNHQALTQLYNVCLGTNNMQEMSKPPGVAGSACEMVKIFATIQGSQGKADSQTFSYSLSQLSGR